MIKKYFPVVLWGALALVSISYFIMHMKRAGHGKVLNNMKDVLKYKL